MISSNTGEANVEEGVLAQGHQQAGEGAQENTLESVPTAVSQVRTCFSHQQELFLPAPKVSLRVCVNLPSCRGHLT